ncbi:MAG: hypothetical protein MHMPM18_000708 [Marteilia pararefringens]
MDDRFGEYDCNTMRGEEKRRYSSESLQEKMKNIREKRSESLHSLSDPLCDSIGTKSAGNSTLFAIDNRGY